MGEGEGDADVGMSMNEVCSAVYRVDNECRVGSKGASSRSFFA